MVFAAWSGCLHFIVWVGAMAREPFRKGGVIWLASVAMCPLLPPQAALGSLFTSRCWPLGGGRSLEIPTVLVRGRRRWKAGFRRWVFYGPLHRTQAGHSGQPRFVSQLLGDCFHYMSFPVFQFYSCLSWPSRCPLLCAVKRHCESYPYRLLATAPSVCLARPDPALTPERIGSRSRLVMVTYVVHHSQRGFPSASNPLRSGYL